MPVNKLRENDSYVQGLRIAIREGTFGLSDVPELIKRVILEDAWREREIEQTGQVATFKRFVDFVAAKPLDGLGTDLATVKRLCRDDAGAVDLIDRVTQHASGPQQTTGNNVPELRPEGNSAAKALRRLRKDRPDLHARVLSGELSPHAAAVEAGFRRRTITVPLEPEAAAAALRRHFTPDQLASLIDLLETTP